MNFKVIKKCFSFVFFILFVNCDNHIIERSANDYFPLKQGDWWSYTNLDLYEPVSVVITVEALDTILQRECYPFNISGDFHYYTRDQDGIKEYIKLTQNYGGDEYTILQGFVTRLELPLVSGNRFLDSLADSVEFFGKWIKGRYLINGLVSDHQKDDVYGEVYRVIINLSKTIITPDSTIASEDYFEEYYAPGIGMVRFKNKDGDFRIKDFHIE
jgi:hypothetical protein|uniref:Uncharacterized protein n=1 Tax=candidate division WOR-3 bacterium TaxID=2052148 RepID=A0A7V3RFV0_UNCW3